jgi:signal transduction histidine kinase
VKKMSATKAQRTVADPTVGALPGGSGLDAVIALVIAAPAVVCLLALDGFPLSLSGWAALLGVLAGAAAVLVGRRDARPAVVLLTLCLISVPAADDVYQQASSPFVQFVSLGPVVAAAVVYCALGATLPLAGSLPWLVGSAAVSWWALGGDAAYLLLGVGWWAIGRVLRSRQEVAEILRIRAAELTAERDRFTAEAIRQERSKIARELHDVVAHCMTVIVIQSRAGQHLLGRDPAAATEAIDVIREVAAEAESDIGALVDLMDPDRTRRLTRQLMDELVSRAARTGAAITVDFAVDPEGLPIEVAVAAHRLVQEGITNAFRHAPGAPISIDLSKGRSVTVEVRNGPAPAGGGAGPDHDRPSLARTGAGRGLTGLRERIDRVGGSVRWGPTATGGWQVAATFPTADN